MTLPRRRRDWCPRCGRRLIVNDLLDPPDRFCGGTWSYVGGPRWEACNLTYADESADADPMDRPVGPAPRIRPPDPADALAAHAPRAGGRVVTRPDPAVVDGEVPRLVNVAYRELDDLDELPIDPNDVLDPQEEAADA